MDVLWNPWHGCKKLSPGCDNCYVYRMDERYGRDSSIVAKTADFAAPIRKKRSGGYQIPPGTLVYTCFTSDFLLREADSWRPEAWRMMRERGDLRFFFITKRISRLKQCLPPDWGEGYPNVEICCTVEDQKRAGERVPILQSAPCAAKSIACEPLIGPVDLTPWLGGWVRRVVVGGESGPGARVCDYDWVLSLRGQCVERGVAFSFRQTGARLKKDGRLYHIERPLQHRQAKKAGIDTDGGPDRKTREDC